MQHRGEIVKEAIYKSGIPITLLAKRLGKSRRWVYLLFDNPNVSVDVMLDIGAIIQTDFSPFLPMATPAYAVAEPVEPYETSNGYWKQKYITLLEEYNAHLKNQKK